MPLAWTSGGGRHAKRPGKGLRYCEACGKNKPEVDFAVNQKVDMTCKRYTDNISKQARMAGDAAMQKWNAIKADPKKLQQVIEAYSKAYRLWTQGGKDKKGVQWCLVTYIEETEASTGVDYVGEKVMMWEKQAIQFWMSVDGGCYTEEESIAKWAKLVSDKDDHITDQKGPPRKRLRFAIKTRDMVNDVNSFKKRRKMVCQDKPLKKASQEDLSKLTKRVQMHHSAGSGSGLNFHDLGKQMVASGEAGDAFSHVGMQMDGVDGLLGGSSSEVEEEVDGEEAEENEGGPDPSVAGKKTKWFDRDRAVNAAHKLCQAKLSAVMSALHGKIVELSDAIADVDKLEAEERRHYTGERLIAESRLIMMRKVLENKAALDAHIQTFKVQKC